MSNLINKIREKGLKKCIQMIPVKIKKMEKFEKSFLSPKKEYAIEKILSREFDTIIIFENHFGYYNIMLQRPQHILRELSDERTLVLYNSYYDVDFKDDLRITEVKNNCFIVDLFYYRKKIFEIIKNQNKKKFLMVYSTDTIPIHQIERYQKEKFKILYEYVDDINEDLISPKQLQMILGRHIYLIENENASIVATAGRLYQDILQKNAKAKVKLISNGVECEQFPEDVKTKDERYVSWLKPNSIKVGYYGALANWIDYDLLKQLSNDKNIQLILIGIEHDDSLATSEILKRENVKYFGKKPYTTLAGYANYFDVCIIPFLINDITLSTSPVKLFEYMAMGKPVVTTPMPECMRYDVVKIATDAQEFRKKIYEAVDQIQDLGYKEKLQRCAHENDWKQKATDIRTFILNES